MVSLTIPAAFLMGGGAPTLIGFFAENGFFAMGFIGASIAISAAALLPLFLKIEK
ncbi:MAG: hypothetical protein RBQ72_09190 [Desulfobacterium sp.]|jgi:hypothetical protein|nr:hypothetical protein [Desulfobacterium sp.]